MERCDSVNICIKSTKFILNQNKYRKAIISNGEELDVIFNKKRRVGI